LFDATTLYSLVLSVFVGVAAGYLGSLMVLEKMALVGDALSLCRVAWAGYWYHVAF
jgi:ABC-type Mn2+/Zn2+ transport system permease subunit